MSTEDKQVGPRDGITPGEWKVIYEHQTAGESPGCVYVEMPAHGDEAMSILVDADWATDEDLTLMAASLPMLEALRVTAGNIRSLGPAGALGPNESYSVWLRTVEAAIARATGTPTEERDG